jgi:glycosyltransferase involved in cell wall biosynthesis
VVQTEPIAAWLHHHAGCRRLVVIANAVQHPLPVLGPSPAGPAAAIHQLGPEDCIPAGRLLLLAAGTKPYKKGFDLLLEAFVAIAPRHPDWDLAIVGLHPDHSEAGLSAAGLSARVHCPGPVADMAAWYARADCFVLSSRFEGIPNVLLEAMAAGLDALLACPASRAALAARATDVRERFSSGLVLQQCCQALALPPPPADSDLSVPLRTAVTTAPTHRQAAVRAAMPPAEIPAGLGPHRRAP